MIQEVYSPAPPPSHDEIEEVLYDGTRIYDIDVNVENPLLRPEIADEVIKNLRLIEVEKRATNYDVATQIDRRSRAGHVDWLIDAAQKLNCAATTLHLAVNYFDRYSSGNPIEIKDLDMVALTCLMIASKFDGVSSEFDFDAYVVLGGGFCEDDLEGMEVRILSYLEYKVAVPTACSFLERFVGAAQCGRHAPLQGLEGMAARVAELSLFSTTMLRSFMPSMVAASSVFLAQYVLDPSRKPWNATLRHYTMYEASDLQDCVLALHNKWCTILEKNHAARSKLSDDPIQILFVDPVTRPRTNKLEEVLSGLIQENQEKELRVRPIERDETKIPMKIKDYSRVISRKFILLLFNFRDLDRFMLLFLYFLVFGSLLLYLVF